MQQSKFEFVDVVRGLAILGVVLFHFTSRSNVIEWLPESLQFIAKQGAHGVQLFFIASAYTLFRSYHFRSGVEKHALRNFVLRRYFRIAPMYYVGIVYYLWQNGMGTLEYVGTTFHNSVGSIVANVFFVHEFNPYYMWLVPGSWSVAAEIAFYMLLPLLFQWIPNLQTALRFLGICIVLRVFSWYGFRELPWVADVNLRLLYANWVLPTQLAVFALGIVLFFILRGDAWPRLGKWELSAWAALVFAEVLSQGGRVFQSELVLSIGFVLMILAMSKMNWKHLPGKVLGHIGKISFSMYVLHWGVIYWLDYYGYVQLEPGMPWSTTLAAYLWRLGLMLGLVVLVSTLTYHLVERQGQRIGRKLILIGEG